jgi:hypothetical protein
MVMLVFWVVKPCGTVGDINILEENIKNGGSMFLQNSNIYLQVHMVLQPRRPTSTYSMPWESQISYC